VTVSTDTAWDNAAAAPAVGLLFLIELMFQSGTLRVTNWPLDITVLGFTWTGLGEVAEIGRIQESEDGSYEKLTIGLSQVQSSNLALALGSAETYQGRPANIWTALVDPTFQIVSTPRLRFAGSMELVHIERDDSGAGKVLLDLQAGAYDVRSNPAALRMNQAQHGVRKPGETGFRYVSSLIGQPKTWLSKTFQQV
jgi:hypothetical protein